MSVQPSLETFRPIQKGMRQGLVCSLSFPGVRPSHHPVVVLWVRWGYLLTVKDTSVPSAPSHDVTPTYLCSVWPTSGISYDLILLKCLILWFVFKPPIYSHPRLMFCALSKRKQLVGGTESDRTQISQERVLERSAYTCVEPNLRAGISRR